MQLSQLVAFMSPDLNVEVKYWEDEDSKLWQGSIRELSKLEDTIFGEVEEISESDDWNICISLYRV